MPIPISPSVLAASKRYVDAERLANREEPETMTISALVRAVVSKIARAD